MLVSLACNIFPLSATAGRINDGIDWFRYEVGEGEFYSPINGDIEFATVAGTARLGLSNFLYFKGGGSYHYIDQELVDDPAYSPEYQFFSGGELHVFWSQKLIDFWAYGEIVYVGPYHGLVDPNLGGRAVINTKMSFKMGNFRFNFVTQNAMLETYYPKDGWQLPGRSTTYGFTWDFID